MGRERLDTFYSYDLVEALGEVRDEFTNEDNQNIELDADKVAKSLADAILNAQQLPVALNVSIDMMQEEVQKVFVRALQDMQLSTSVHLEAVGIDISSFNHQIHAAIQHAISTVQLDVPVQINFDTEELSKDLTDALLPELRKAPKRAWNHTTTITDTPPTEDILDKAGREGYELVNIIYNEREKQWHSYFKKLIEVYE